MIQAEIYWRLKVKSQGMLPNPKTHMIIENIPVDLDPTDDFNINIQFGWPPKTYSLMTWDVPTKSY